MKWACRLIPTAIIAFALLGPAERAQEQTEAPPQNPAQEQTQAQPNEVVARVSIVDGNVATERGGAGEWVATTVNAPVDRGDKVSTADKSRTEVQLDYANVLRLNQNSVVTIADLTRSRIQVQIAQGTMSYAVFKGSQADAEIDTPNMAVHPLSAGSYRIQVNSPDQTELTVLSGQAEVSVPQGSTTVEKGQLITVQGSDSPQYKIGDAGPKDDWDRWNEDRDREILSAASWQHTNRYYTGTEDLDRHGRWTQVPDYGDVWQPDEGRDWAPYRDGRWAWDPYYGWTWVSYESWGWAPYHYGRWIDWEDQWYWWPGYVTPYYYPVWAPAYVSFFGFGWGFHHFGWGFGWGFGSFGWCPLGPVDPFFPWWGFGNRFSVVNVTNITNITNITNVTNSTNGRFQGGRRVIGSNLGRITSDPHVRGSISTTSADGFGTGRVPRNQHPVSVASLRDGHVVNGRLPVVPTRASLQPIDKTVNRGAIPRGAGQTRFFATHAPPARPASFTARAGEIQQMMKTQSTLRPMPVGRGASPERSGTAGGPGIPTPGQMKPERPQSGQGNQPGLPTRSGWQRFGQGSPTTGGARNPQTPARGATPNSNLRPFTRPQAGTTPSAPAQRGTAQGGRTFQPRTAPRAEPPKAQGQSGFQKFTPRTEAPPAHIQGGERTVQPRAAPQSGWKPFTPRTESAPQPRVQGGRWERPAPQTGYSSPGRYAPSGGGQWSRPSPSYSRPQLQIGRPIVSSPRYGGGYSGGGGQVRSSGGGGGGRTSGGSFGGSRGGGGGSWGGGGARSSGGGGGHSSGGSGGGHSSSPHR